MSDERLAKVAAGGSQAAFAMVFERHHRALHRYCYSIVGNSHDAADALQTTMVRVLRALPGETREIALRPWLYRIAHNESVSLLRARRPESALSAAAEIADHAGEAAVASRERLRVLRADLRELTAQQRGALVMREMEGLEFTQIATALGVSASAAKQSVYEARCALQVLKEGRAMDCELVRRAISDGDRRALRAKRVGGHLRACQGCRDFQASLATRPAQLTALFPPLPAATAAGMLHSLLGGTVGGGGGGGAAAGLSAAKAGGALSVGAKLATVAVIGTAAVGGLVAGTPSTRGGTDARHAPATRSATATPPVEAVAHQGDSAVVRSDRTSAAGSVRTRSGSRADARTASDSSQPPGRGALGPNTSATSGGRPASAGRPSNPGQAGRGDAGARSPGAGSQGSRGQANAHAPATPAKPTTPTKPVAPAKPDTPPQPVTHGASATPGPPAGAGAGAGSVSPAPHATGTPDHPGPHAQP